ncbi:hypothetical protein PFNF135_00892 [Plasmodium falciparum NF135/5.C10]|uniref:Uncharacterized protein n=2 Tax=Plasmodium falciparum TaxID=5833 RepID=A0A024WFS3_PLAFA|nr:hypothetical protein PFNF135_00892 [Plasmodium falciparum NF135/5.C10]ETW45743.1 hypothetical protein PFMALIP_06196 [Plasmodium falciparum MaliPS096_E11]
MERRYYLKKNDKIFKKVNIEDILKLINNNENGIRDNIMLILYICNNLEEDHLK